MKNGLSALYLGVLSLFAPLCIAQVQDSLELPEVIVEEDVFHLLQKNRTSSIQRITIRNQDLGKNLGQLLQSSPGLFFRDQGNGLVSTASFNGFGPSQIRVEWNGFEINHPMLGLVDGSMVQSAFLSSVDYSTSYASSTSGTMAMGGVISLKSSDLRNNFTANYTINTMGNHVFNLAFPLSSNVSITAMYGYDHNRFEYTNRIFDRDEIRTNNNREWYGIQINTVNSIFGKELKTALWLQQTERAIPGPIGTPQSNSEQKDVWIRISNKINLQDGSDAWNLFWNLSTEQLDYRDSTLALFGSDELSESMIYRNQIRSTKRVALVESFWLDFTLERSDLWANTNNYEEIKYRGLSKAISHLNWNLISSVFFSQTFQLEHYSDFGWYLSQSYGLNWELINGASIYSNISRAYTPPTFNDLFWPELGNPDLVPQYADKLEIGFRSQKKVSSFEINIEPSVLLANTYNGIQWLPENGNWRPQNITQVDHLSLNLISSLNYKSRLWSNRFQLFGSLTRAEFASSRFVGDQSVGNQVLYVPLYQFGFSDTFSRKNSSISMNYNFVSERYINESNTNTVDAYQILDLRVNQKFSINKSTLIVSIDIQNVLNQSFEIVSGYPQPQRQFGFRVALNI